MLTIDEFQEYVANHLKEHMPGDREIAEVRAQMVNKLNDTHLHAVIVRPVDSNVAPTVYLDGYYERYLETRELLGIMEDIAYTAAAHLNGEDLYPNIAEEYTNLDAISDRIVMVVVNAEKNADYLEELPHTMREDLAIVYKVLLDMNDEGVGSITIRNEHMAMWGVDVEYLHQKAMENSERLLPVKMDDMSAIMARIMGDDIPADALMDMFPVMAPRDTMYVISNNQNVNGAAAIIYSDVLAKLSEQLESDLYILPSSTHEVIAVSTLMNGGADVEALSAMVREVNATQVKPEEQLSDHVYHYDAATRELKLADTTVEELGLVSSKGESEKASEAQEISGPRPTRK